MKLEFDKLVVLDRVTRLIDADNGLCNRNCELLLFPFEILFVCFKLFLFINTDDKLVLVVVKLDIIAGFVCNTAAERAS